MIQLFSLLFREKYRVIIVKNGKDKLFCKFRWDFRKKSTTFVGLFIILEISCGGVQNISFNNV